VPPAKKPASASQSAVQPMAIAAGSKA
jgi:hypothetical protein